jgi:murein DD-endopeptidase MepM/ murein hydrolase activator NlpD
MDGVVTFAGRSGRLGLVIEIEHEDHLKTVYAHNRKILVKSGQRVRQGSVISQVGSTGYSTGPHLHFEVWKNGKHVNPTKYLPTTQRSRSQAKYARR